MAPKGYLMLTLHAHLPFVRHPEHERFMEEDWLFEAITETYIPLLEVYNGLVRDGVDFRVTMTMTPPLCEMLADPLLQERYAAHARRMIELGAKEATRTHAEPRLRKLALKYLRDFERSLEVFESYGGNLVRGFKRMQDLGKLEIVTCGATHGFQPLLQPQLEASNAQVEIARANYEKHFGRQPRGIWNGECGYYQGLEQYLQDAGIRYFFVDTHGILYADKRPKYGVFAPLYCPNGVAAFGRDVDSSKSVWSAEEGYPGNPVYRDFYRDIGFDSELDYIKPYIHPDGIRHMTGYKYYRVTGRGVELDKKDVYDADRAKEQTAWDAGNFLENRIKQVEHLASLMDREPMVVSPYDAELYGHWWYEGPQFLDYLLRKMHFDQDVVKTITPSEYLDRHPANQVARPSFSSWGHKGYCEVWLEGSNDWIYRHLHKAAERMIELARDHRDASDPTLVRALNQAARELLLAQSSDWAFIMKTGTTVQYAVKRTRDHVARFTNLWEMIRAHRIDEKILREYEWKDNIFEEIDYRVYAKEVAAPALA